MDTYYLSSKFKGLLKEYENFCKNGMGSFLDADDFADIGHYYINIGDKKKSEEVIEQALKIFPNSGILLAFKARDLLYIQDNPQAALRLLLNIDDDLDIEYLLITAEIYIYMNDFKAVDETFNDAYNRLDEEDRDDYCLEFADILINFSQPDFAEKWLNMCDSKDSSLYKEVKAKILQERGEYEKSEAIFKNLLDKDPYASNYWNELAINQTLSKDFSGVITSSNYALAINPEDENALVNKASALLNLGNHEEALKCFLKYKELVNEGDTSSVDIAIGHILMTADRMEEAQKYHQMAFEVAEDKVLTTIMIAISCFEHGYVEHCYNTMKYVLDIVDEEWTMGFGYLARCCYELKKKDEYDKYLKLAIKRNPDEAKDLLSDLYPENIEPEKYLETPLLDFMDE